MKKINSQKKGELPIQELLKGEYLQITRLHKDLDRLSIIPHRHDHYELILVKDGKGKHTIDYKPFDLKPDRVFFIHKGQVHLIEHFERDGWIIMFGEELLNRFLQLHKHENEQGLLDSYTPYPYIDLDEKLKTIFSLIIEQLQTELSAEKQDVDIMLHYVSLMLLHANKVQMVQHPKEQISLANRQILFKLKTLIEENFKQEHLAAFYADQLNMDIKKINRICRESTGSTLFELLQERLITECKIQLQTSTGSVKEISYDLGFNDPAFFGRFFKKHTNYTPLEFKKQRAI
ncbi:MAG: hypothetical protein CMO01_15115 [Thalassobius sp.]|nr:hypothetical protein [Thalassovita sp.]